MGLNRRAKATSQLTSNLFNHREASGGILGQDFPHSRVTRSRTNCFPLTPAGSVDCICCITLPSVRMPVTTPVALHGSVCDSLHSIRNLRQRHLPPRPGEFQTAPVFHQFSRLNI